jgi:dolichol-phosphate mannosyltransferase
MNWIILPAYNEENSLPKLIPKLDEQMRSSKLEYKLVVCDDGSFDNTAPILLDLQEKYPILIITHEINRGLGEAERDLFEYAANSAEDNDYIIRLEGDDTHDPKYVIDLIHKLEEGYDVVNTSRFQPGGGASGLSFFRTMLSRAANGFMKLLFGIKGVKDFSCGFRIYKASVIKDAISIYGNYFIQMKGLGFTSTLEVLVKLNMMGCKFAEVPFVLRYDMKESASKMVASVTTLGYFSMAILYLWPFGGWKNQYKQLRKKYPENRIVAVDKFGYINLKKRSASKISF